jgi:hypothetical protein
MQRFFGGARGAGPGAFFRASGLEKSSIFAFF